MSFAVTPYQQSYNREELIRPFIQSFDESASKLKSQFSLTQSLDLMFPEQKRQDRDIAKAKEALGELAKEFSDTELKEIVTDIDYLVTHWLDDFERTLFDGLTLRELIHEKGGLL